MIHAKQKTTLVRCDTCMAVDEEHLQEEQANTFAMAMKQDISEKTTLTTQDQPAAETNKIASTMPYQPDANTRPHNTTSAPAENLVVVCAQPVATETHLNGTSVVSDVLQRQPHPH